MRRLFWLGACALGMLYAVGTFADVRHTPLRVQWVGPPPVLEAGQPVTGTLRFLVSEPVALTNVRVEGAGWSGRIVESPANLGTARSGRFDFRFEATGKDFTQPLVVRFEADGVTKEQVFDLREVAAAAVPGEVKRVPETVDPFRSLVGALVRPEAPGTEDPLAVWGKPDRVMPKTEAPSAVTARNIRVYGRFTYTRSDGRLMGADGVAVRIYDEDTGSDELLATVATDAGGYYDVTFYWDPCAVFCDQQPDLYVQFKSANFEIDVQTTGGNTYSWASGTTSDYTGTSLNMGWLTPSDETRHPALHILTDLTRDWRWYLSYEGYNLPSVGAYWPDGSSGAWYDSGTEDLHFGTDRSWREDSQAHEYGHHFIYNYAVGQTPDYCNGICDGPTGCGHCLWCQETNHDAWNEGWPNWICHVQTTSYLSDYGVAAMNTRDQENVQPCTTTLDDPTITEGFLGALLQDIWDSTNEDDPLASGTWRDRLSMGYNEIFTVTDIDHPLNPLDFITKFKNRYPAYKEQIWETAKNNTYEVDAANPSAVTNLTSSHAVGSSSPDPTVQFNWTRANDDWSGPSGYSITVQATSSLPDASQDIGDVTTWTSGVLSPGTYRFNIRTRDRAGHWSTTYATYGPFTIREAEPANLTAHQFSGWAHEVVARGTDDATFGSVTNPTAPIPSGNTTYWNAGGVNNGESATSTGFVSYSYVDGSRRWGASWGTVNAGQGFYAINIGPTSVQGGRHTMETRYDYNDAIAETDETDNLWAHQWIWEPLALASNTTVTRSAPPPSTAGWDAIVDGSVKWFNADGLRFNTGVSGQWWHGVYVYATNLDEDYDCRLHFATSSADTGFAGNHGYSARGPGYLDAVLVNRNQVSSPTNWDVGVLNHYEGTSSYVAREVASSILDFGDSLTVAMDAGEMMLLREFYLGTPDTGWVSLSVKILSGEGPVYVQWRNEGFSLGDLSDYSYGATCGDTSWSRITVHKTSTGWQNLCLYRNPVDGTDPVTLLLEISATMPDYAAFTPAGWYSPFVPRPAFDGMAGSVPDPDTLYGNVAGTYLNWAVSNVSPVGGPALTTRAYIDGVYSVGIGWSPFPAYATRTLNWDLARTVRGGRHTLSVYHDYAHVLEEIRENNNWYGEQYIWSPYVLSMGVPVSRAAPPDRTGGWDLITTGSLAWYNSDGLRMPRTPYSGSSYFWQAVAVMSGSSSNVDLRLHDLVPGAHEGFGTNHGVSGWGTGQSDYCLANFNLMSPAAFDAGVLNVSGTESYTAEFVGSAFRGSYPDGIYGPYTLGANHLLDLHEFYLAAGTYTVGLFDEGGSVDWGVTVHPTGTPFMTKSTAVAGGVAWLNGPGQSEICTATIPTSNYYCVAVWKSRATDRQKTGTYRLQVRPLTVDVADGLPARTTLGAVFPNPVTSGATVSFDLASGGDVRLELYDLHGARVRTLADGRWEPGRWQVTWNGMDDAGQEVAPGVYFLRLQGPDGSGSRRVVKTR